MMPRPDSGDRHEYIVLAAGGKWADKVEVGQALYTKKYEGKERTWEFVRLSDMEPTGWVTGLHRRKVNIETLKTEANA